MEEGIGLEEEDIEGIGFEEDIEDIGFEEDTGLEEDIEGIGFEEGTEDTVVVEVDIEGIVVVEVGKHTGQPLEPGVVEEGIEDTVPVGVVGIVVVVAFVVP